MCYCSRNAMLIGEAAFKSSSIQKQPGPLGMPFTVIDCRNKHCKEVRLPPPDCGQYPKTNELSP